MKLSYSNNHKIIKLIPQKPPFVMVGDVVSSDDKTTVTTFTIAEDNILVENGYFSESGIIENIAQTMAVRGGLQKEKSNGEAAIGMIGAIKNLIINSLPPVNSTITTTVEVDREVFNACLINGSVVLNNRLIAKCEMKIFLKKD